MPEVTASVKRTPDAIQKNIEGKVKLRLLVDETGHVRKVTALNKLGYGLDEVAELAARKLVFSPAKIHSKPVALEAIYIVNFSINHN